MVLGYMTLDDLDVHSLTDLSDQIPKPNCHLTVKNRLAVFGDPNHMVLDVIDTVGSLAVVLHNTASLLKSSPKGEGFSPIPRRGQ